MSSTLYFLIATSFPEFHRFNITPAVPFTAYSRKSLSSSSTSNVASNSAKLLGHEAIQSESRTDTQTPALDQTSGIFYHTFYQIKQKLA